MEWKFEYEYWSMDFCQFVLTIRQLGSPKWRVFLDFSKSECRGICIKKAYDDADQTKKAAIRFAKNHLRAALKALENP